MRIKYQIVEGKTCPSCGFRRRDKATRKCLTCLYEQAYTAMTHKTCVGAKLREAYQICSDLERDYRYRVKGRIARQHRRAAEMSAPGRFTKAQVDRILVLQHGRCSYCDETEGLHLDHVVPLSRGGSNYPWNLQWLCAFHNVSKGARTDFEYRAILGLPLEEPISYQLWRSILAC